MADRPIDVITDAEIDRVHANANFGSTPKRSVVNEALLKVACGYSNGHTAGCILAEHGLVRTAKARGTSALTARGRKYLWAVYRQDSEVVALRERVSALEGILNTPEVNDFVKGVKLEAAHQQHRWGVEHDREKGPLDWFWLIGYLAQKAAAAALAGDVNKAKHHTVSTAAALANWHRSLSKRPQGP